MAAKKSRSASQPGRGFLDHAEGKEKDAAKRGGANIKGQPFAGQAQIRALVGKQSAFAKIHPRDGQAGHLTGNQFLLHFGVELLRRKQEFVHREYTNDAGWWWMVVWMK